MKILVVLEHDQQQLRPGSLSAIGFANDLARQSGGEVLSLLIGGAIDSLAQEAAQFTPLLAASSPLLADPKAKRNTPAMLVHTGKIYGSATEEIPSADDERLYHGPGVPWYVMLAEGQFKYVRNLIAGEVEELYDLKRDPEELKNLALQPRQLRTDVRRGDLGFRLSRTIP